MILAAAPPGALAQEPGLGNGQEDTVAPASVEELPEFEKPAASLEPKATDSETDKDQEKPSEPVSSIDNLLDVDRSHWGYQDLDELINVYGCVAGYKNSTEDSKDERTFRGEDSATRFEAVTLLNTCLDSFSSKWDVKSMGMKLTSIENKLTSIENIYHYSYYYTFITFGFVIGLAVNSPLKYILKPFFTLLLQFVFRTQPRKDSDKRTRISVFANSVLDKLLIPILAASISSIIASNNDPLRNLQLDNNESGQSALESESARGGADEGAGPSGVADKDRLVAVRSFSLPGSEVVTKVIL